MLSLVENLANFQTHLVYRETVLLLDPAGHIVGGEKRQGNVVKVRSLIER